MEEGLRGNEIPIFENYILDSSKKLGGDINDVSVFPGINKLTKEQFAFKLVKITVKEEIKLIYHELKILKILENIERVPKTKHFGQQGLYIILVMDLLGPSLKKCMKYCEGKFSLATTLKISLQLLDILKQIHDKGIILRYIKPDNITIGRKKNKKYIYIIDFGIAKKYIRNGKHIVFRDKKHIKGNRDYISINIHKKKEASRRDDIESFGYILIYFLKGELPWSHIGYRQGILWKKIETNLDELCEGAPEEFKKFIEHGKNLEFEQEPDYDYLKELLLKAAKNNGIDLDKVEYDWDIKKNKEKKKNNNNEDNILNGENKKDKNDNINVNNDNEKLKNNNMIIDENNVNEQKINQNDKGKEDEENNKEKTEEKDNNKKYEDKKEIINNNEINENKKDKICEEKNNSDENKIIDEKENFEEKKDTKKKEINDNITNNIEDNTTNNIEDNITNNKEISNEYNISNNIENNNYKNYSSHDDNNLIEKNKIVD